MNHETYIKIYNISQWIFLIIGLIFMLDGLFILPSIKTRYGFTNIGLNYSLIFIGVSAYFMLIKRIHKLEDKINNEV